MEHVAWCLGAGVPDGTSRTAVLFRSLLSLSPLAFHVTSAFIATFTTARHRTDAVDVSQHLPPHFFIIFLGHHLPAFPVKILYFLILLVRAQCPTNLNVINLITLTTSVPSLCGES
jgi:hypothetical protein